MISYCFPDCFKMQKMVSPLRKTRVKKGLHLNYCRSVRSVFIWTGKSPFHFCSFFYTISIRWIKFNLIGWKLLTTKRRIIFAMRGSNMLFLPLMNCYLELLINKFRTIPWSCFALFINQHFVETTSKHNRSKGLKDLWIQQSRFKTR